MKAPEALATQRLRLRRPQHADAQAIFATYANDIDVTRYLSWPRHVSLDDTNRFLDFADNEWQCSPAGPYLIELLSNGSLIGSTGLEFHSAVIASTGYVLAKHAWGQGYATEVLSAMVTLTPQLGVRSLFALCHPQNTASCRILEKCGFICEGVLEQRTIFPNLDSIPVATLGYSKSFE